MKIRFLIIGVSTLLLVGLCERSAGAATGAEQSAGLRFKNPKTVKMLADGGRVYALSERARSQMHSVVFVTPKGRVFVVDGGCYGDDAFLVPLLKSLGGTVDCWFLTHAHEDHYGALVHAYEKGDPGLTVHELVYAFPDRAFMERHEPDCAPHLKRFYACLAAHETQLPRGDCSPGRTIDLDGWTFTILNAPFVSERNPINNSSVMLSIRAGGKSWLVTGDLGAQAAEHFLRTIPEKLPHDIVFLAHHGQGGGSKAFYAKVRPTAAIWPTPDWLWENRRGELPGSGPYQTNYTKCWMQELGVKQNYVLTRDWIFE